MKNKLKIILPLSLLIISVWAIIIFTKDSTISAVSSRPKFGQLQVTVVDGMTDTPLKDATIVIPELDKTFKTNEQGIINVDSIPIISSEHYEDILPQNWGEITLLIYKDGYLPYALFYTQVISGQTRKGPKIYLFKESQSQEKQPFSIIEGPERNWVNELIKKYKP